MEQIKMDVSEYEAMQENKKLLEESLKREKELSAEVSKLQKEKIEALKQNEKRVVKVTTHKSRQFIIQKLPDYEIAQRIEREFSYLLRTGAAGRGFKPTRLINNDADLAGFKRLADLFFDIEKAHDVVDNEEITTHGLDEIKKELREQIESGITTAQKKKLEDAKVALKKQNELIEKIEHLQDDNNALQSSLQRRNEALEDLRFEIDRLSLEVQNARGFLDFFNHVKLELQGKIPVFGKREILENLTRLVEETSRDYEIFQEKVAYIKKQQNEQSETE
jgi:hypothetical protein